MDLSVQTETYGGDDLSWLGSAFATTTGRPVTLDVSAFTESTAYPDGYFPSGTPLGLITASGLYGPYTGAASDGTENLAGFLLTSVPAPRDGASNVVGSLLEFGRVIVAKLPLDTVDATAQATNPRFVYA
jgi:hypothetical protein